MVEQRVVEIEENRSDAQCSVLSAQCSVVKADMQCSSATHNSVTSVGFNIEHWTFDIDQSLAQARMINFDRCQRS
jgi:hypothetical protein